MRKVGLLWFATSNIKIFFLLMICIGIFLAFVLIHSHLRNHLKKMFLSENVIFQGTILSLGHFGQQAPERPVSQPQNSVPTSSLPSFIVDLLTF